MIFNNVNRKGDVFADFYAAKDPAYGPGWYIFGCNDKYGGRYVKRCGTPDKKPRKHPNYNAKSIAGWKTKKEAEANIKLIPTVVS